MNRCDHQTLSLNCCHNSGVGRAQMGDAGKLSYFFSLYFFNQAVGPRWAYSSVVCYSRDQEYEITNKNVTKYL